MSAPRGALLLCATLFVFSLALAVMAAPNDEVGPEAAALGYVPGQILVKFSGWVSDTAKAALNAEMKAKEMRKGRFGNFSVVRLERGASVQKAAAAYRKKSGVVWAEPNYIVKPAFVPDDPLYWLQWHLYNPVYKGINVEGAWDITMGDPSVKVAVVDTGVAYEDYDEDGDGFYDYLQAPDLAGTRFTQPYDSYDGDSHANDEWGHGTLVTGTIAQTTNNGLGCAGVAPNVTIVPVRALGPYGGTNESVANGIYYATFVGAKVINMSLGDGDPYAAPSAALRDACWYAYSRGVTVVAAAGNDSKWFISYPAGYDESVIAVGATRYDNALTYYSNYGSSKDTLFFGLPWRGQGLDVVAPGGESYDEDEVLEDLNGDGFPDGVLQQTFYWVEDPITGSYKPTGFEYMFADGTSMAAPHVSGVAALLASIGVSRPDEIRSLLQSTAQDLGDPGYDTYYGWGLVDAEAAVLTAALTYNQGPNANAGPDQIVTDSDSNGAESILLDGSDSTWSPGFPIVSYEWRENGVLLAAGVTPTISLGVGVHTIALTCRDSMGKTDADTVAITVRAGPPIVRVLGIDVESRLKSGKTYLCAVVTVVDGLKRPVYRASVNGKWSGSLTKTMRALYTNAQGQVVFTPGTLRPGTYTFTVTRVYKSGYTYRSDLNAETSDTRTFY